MSSKKSQLVLAAGRRMSGNACEAFQMLTFPCKHGLDIMAHYSYVMAHVCP